MRNHGGDVAVGADGVGRPVGVLGVVNHRIDVDRHGREVRQVERDGLWCREQVGRGPERGGYLIVRHRGKLDPVIALAGVVVIEVDLAGCRVGAAESVCHRRLVGSCVVTPRALPRGCCSVRVWICGGGAVKTPDPLRGQVLGLLLIGDKADRIGHVGQEVGVRVIGITGVGHGQDLHDDVAVDRGGRDGELHAGRACRRSAGWCRRRCPRPERKTHPGSCRLWWWGRCRPR